MKSGSFNASGFEKNLHRSIERFAIFEPSQFTLITSFSKNDYYNLNICSQKNQDVYRYNLSERMVA